MMKLCTEGCGEWAQWRVAVVRHPDSKERERERKQKLHPQGPEIEVIGFVCTAHKEKLETAPRELNLRFTFVGAVARL